MVIKSVSVSNGLYTVLVDMDIDGQIVSYVVAHHYNRDTKTVEVRTSALSFRKVPDDVDNRLRHILEVVAAEY